MAAFPCFGADERPVVKDWTLAVFLNADNNLDQFGVEDQDEMARVGSSDWFNIVTLIDRERGPASYNYIEKGKITKIKDLGELDMGDYRQMVTFMKWVKANYPAKKYILTIWNHGSGWKQAGRGIVRGISYDDSSNNHITTEQLGVALKEIAQVLGQKIDILNMDACLMQMAEVAYVCREFCHFIVASEDVEPGKGTPYDDVFKNLKNGQTAVAFTRLWVKAFIGSYNNGSQGFESCTQSAVRLSALNAVKDAVDGFAKAAMAGSFHTQFAKALAQVQKFEYKENIDLPHFVQLVKEQVSEEGMQTACNKLLAALKSAVHANGSVDAAMKNAMGLAIYFPAYSYSFDGKYRELAFSKATLWDDMIADYHKKNTAAMVVNNLEAGSLDELRNYTVHSSRANREISKHVIERVKFRLHTEGGLNQGLTASAEVLLKELAEK
jgi:hypothetical protein